MSESKQLFKDYKAQGSTIHKSLPARVQNLQALIAQFTLQSPGEVQKKFTEVLKDGGDNVAVETLYTAVQNAISQFIDDFSALSLWISLMVPEIHDGNNFGVSVQGEILKVIKEQITRFKGDFDNMPQYFWKRGEVRDKLSSSSTKSINKTTKSTGTSTSNKNEDSKDTKSRSDSQDDKTDVTQETVNSTSDNSSFNRFLVAHDSNEYFHLRYLSTELLQAYAAVYLLITNNMSKVTKPRGSSGHRGMY